MALNEDLQFFDDIFEGRIAQVLTRTAHDMLATLDEKDRRIIRKRYGMDDGKPQTFVAIAADEGMRVRTVQDRVKKNMRLFQGPRYSAPIHALLNYTLDPNRPLTPFENVILPPAENGGEWIYTGRYAVPFSTLLFGFDELEEISTRTYDVLNHFFSRSQRFLGDLVQKDVNDLLNRRFPQACIREIEEILMPLGLQFGMLFSPELQMRFTEAKASKME